MKHIFGFLLLFILGLSLQDAPDRQLKDFHVFKNIIMEKEGNVDLHVAKKDINTAFNFAEKSLGLSKSLLDQYKVYALTLSVIQCGHTQIYPTKEVYREWLGARNSLPADLVFVGRHLVSNELDSKDLEQYRIEHGFQSQPIPEGAEVIMIDNKTIPEMMDEMGLFISSDEGDEAFKYFQAQYIFEFYHHLALPYNSNKVPVVFISKNDTVKVELPTGTAAVYTMNKRLVKSSVAAMNEDSDIGEFEIKQGAGYFRFKSFKASYGKKYTEFLESSFKKIKTRKIKKLIIDLRGNTGGVMQYEIMKYFVGSEVYLGRYVIEKPKLGIENKYLKKHNSDYRKHKRSSRAQKRLIRKGDFDNGRVLTDEVDDELIYSGAIVVITDEGTFSSAAILACHLKTLANAKIIGRPAGGSFYKGNAGTLTAILPYSKLRFFVNPNTFYSQLSDQIYDPSIKNPDVFLDALIIDQEKQDQYYYKAAKRAFD